jgi:UDP-N-acetylmuramyl pentapeptide synthase
LAYSKKYPKYIVLEYGIDHDGEMDFLLEIARPNVGIILNISKNHVLQFPDFEIYKREKLKLPLNSKKIIYNLDDVNIEKKF